jgi:hypothetical protein
MGMAIGKFDHVVLNNENARPWNFLSIRGFFFPIPAVPVGHPLPPVRSRTEAMRQLVPGITVLQ